MELVCGHGSPTGHMSHLKQRHVFIFPRFFMRNNCMVIKKNSVDELVEGNGGANGVEIGQMKSRHRK